MALKVPPKSIFAHVPELGPLNDFKNFLFMVWQFLDLPEPTELQYDIADYLQYSENPWSIIMAYRGTGKSYITAAFVVWCWLVDPQLKILVISAAEDKAKDFAKLVKQIINGIEICEHLRPRKDQLDSALSMDVGPATPSKDPSLNVYGIGGQITGGRADIIIPDDVEIPGNSATVTQREQLAKKLNEIIAIIKPTLGGRPTLIKVLGTPQTEQSIYFTLESQGFAIRIWPARYPQDVDKYKGRLAPMLAEALQKEPFLSGQVTNPKMHNEADQKKRALGRKAWYQLQYMLDPSLSDAERYPLKLRDTVVMSIDPTAAPVFISWSSDERVMVKDPEVPIVGLNGDRLYHPWKTSDNWQPYQRKIMAIDPAGGQDETAYVVLYFLMGYIYLADWGGFQGYGSEVLTKLAQIAKQHDVDTVYAEKNFGGGLFTEVFRPTLNRHHPCTLEEVHSVGQKEKRICDTLEMVMASHRLIISESILKKDFESTEKQELQGFYQLTHITRDRGSLSKDDRVDALAIGVSVFTDMVAHDVEENEAKLDEEAREKHLTRWMAMATRGQSFKGGRDEGPMVSLGGEGHSSLEDELMAEADMKWYEVSAYGD